MKLDEALKKVTPKVLAKHYAAQFRSNIMRSVDIHGRPLAPLKSGEARRPLLKSGRLAASIVAQGGTVRATVPYAAEVSQGRHFMGPPQDLGDVVMDLLRQ